MIQHLLAKLQESIATNESNKQPEVKEVKNATNPTNPTNPTNAPSTIHLDTPFKLPMEYLPEDQLCPIDKSVLSDLELIECTKQVNDTTNSANNDDANESNTTSKPMYAHVFQPQSAFAKRYLGMWAKQFTTSVPHLQDTQRFIASVSKDKDKEDQYKED